MVSKVRAFACFGPQASEAVADSSDFLRKYPWPGRAISDTFNDSNHRKGSLAQKFMSAMKVVCGSTGHEEDLLDDDDETEEQSALYDQAEATAGRPFYWTRQLQRSFREELEKYALNAIGLLLSY